MVQTVNDRDENRNRTRRSDNSAINKRLADLGERLGDVKKRKPPPDDAERRGNAMGIAFKIATELLAGVLVGGFIGWQLDSWLETTPVFLLVFFVLGAGAGILNVMRSAYRMQSDAAGVEKKSKQSGHTPESE